MYLRSLELLGFKSFARKTELRFPPGVAAVVGPNGCGKSNVLDALRWALGEQSAKALRGAEMADVIFNGNDRLPALGMAEVSLTFSDCERELGTAYHEVCVTRRVYRDGGSEYLLNGVNCRLRDIQELFMDTGIGRSAYSVMEQGRIDQILSSRPEERRAIFEEAAGITKYKSQRRDALRKLEATEANLARLADVLGEVRRQLGTLGRQAAKARRWQALHADLKLLETHVAHGEFQRLTNDALAAGAALANARTGLETAARALADDESVLGYRRAALERHDHRLEAARAALNEANSRLAHAESRLTFNRERLVEGAARIERLRTDLAEGRATLTAAQARLEETGAAERAALERLAEGQELQRAEDARLRDLRHGRTGAEAALTAAARRVAEAEHRINAARAELARAETEQAAAGARRDLLTREIATAAPALDAAAARVAGARAASLAANATLEAIRAEAADAEAAALGAQREAAALDAAERTAARAAADVNGRLDALRRLAAEGEGLAAGAKAALRGAGRGDVDKARILGALGALIRVRDPQHLVAVETALGAHLGTVLVADEEAGALILQTLAERKLGRAAVAPPVPAPAAAPTPLAGALPALHAVEFPPPAAALLGRLLADTFLVADLPAARALRRERPDAAAVTLAGEWLSREGVWHGGRAANDGAGQSILQRQSQIATLATEAASARAALAAATAQREAATARAAELVEAGRAARVRVNAAQGEATTAAAAVGPLDREERGLRLRLEGFRKELTDFERRFQEIAGRAARLGADMAAQTAARERAEVERTEAGTRVEDLRTQEAALTESVNEIRVRVAAENQRHAGLQREKLPVVARVRELETLLANRQRELEDGERRLAGSAVEAEQLGGTIAIARTEGEIATKQVAELVGERAATITAIGELEAALRARRTEVAALQERRAAEEVREAGLRLRADTLHAQIAERYQTDLRRFAPDPVAFESVRYVRADEARADGGPTDTPSLVARLHEGLEAIGAVTLDSIAEHDALEERHRFLETQDSDLRRAEAELRGIIAKINETSRGLFLETFTAIRRGFGEMFGELFGGGRADLQLMDGDDPLECGIEITARPPGKPAQSLSLLSGGEKTLTAVALLFAIYLVKPSPFCVLDEMDAPLDESNVGRFVRLLDRFAATSQFVVITHNKRTMARADALFGVTMEEPGISKLVAVRLARADEAGVDGVEAGGRLALG